MKVTTLVFAISFSFICSDAFPKELIKIKQADQNKLDNQENVDLEKGGKKPDDLKGSKHSGSDTAAAGEQKTNDGDIKSNSDVSKVTTDTTGLVNQQYEYTKRCPDVVCAPPPSITDGSCQTSNDPSLNIMGPIVGPLSECCLLWICTRQDGSFFIHYGVVSIKGTEIGSTGGAGGPSNNHFSHANIFRQNQFSNSLPFTFGNFGPLNNFGGFESYHGQGQPITTAAVGFSGQFLNPAAALPSFPFFPIQSPFPPQPIASTSISGIFRNRRDSNPQQTQNINSQPRMIRQGTQENNRRLPMQFPQFY